MNAFDIPKQSAFAGDPAFYGQRLIQHRGAPMQIGPGRPRVAVNKEALIAYRLSGKTMRDCAKEFGVSTKWIYLNCKDFPSVEIAERQKTYKYAVNTEAVKAMRDTGATYEAIAKHFGMTIGATRFRLQGHPKPRRMATTPQADKQRKRAAKGTTGAAYEIRLSAEQREIVRRMGGAVWVRSLIDKEAA